MDKMLSLMDAFVNKAKVEELEKIRAEIAENGNSDINTQTVLSIIDKHIKEINNE